MTPEELFHQCLEVLPSILRVLGRQKRLSSEEVEDLGADIQVKLLEDDYQLLREWKGGSLKVYLTIVVSNIWLDRVRGEIGRIHVSAAARELGPPAPELEVLLGREGLTLEEAYQVLKPRFPGLSRSDAEEIAAKINPRGGRRFENVDVIAGLSDPEPTGEKLLEQQEKLAKKRKALDLMHRRLSELSEEDRILLVRAHAEGVKFSNIAKSLGIVQGPLYRRNGKLLAKLRIDLEDAGIRWEDVREVLGIDEPPESGSGERAGADLSQARCQDTLDLENDGRDQNLRHPD